MNLEKFSPRKESSWKLLLAAVMLIGLFAFSSCANRAASPNQNQPAQTVSEPVAKPEPVENDYAKKVSEALAKPKPVAKPEPATNPKPVKPVAKIGVTTGYDYDHPFLNDDGLCEFTIDNTRNDMPVYVRIWDVGAQLPVRAFTIAQGDKFTAENLSPGIYEVRYKELYENAAPPYGSKSEPTTLEQIETYDGTSYSIVELTLYKVHGGNTTTTRIDADDV